MTAPTMTIAQAIGAVAGSGPMPTGGRWGWYRDHEGNEYRRVSRLVKYAETDTYNLEQWKLRQVAEGLAIRDDLVLAVKAMGRPDPVDGWTREQKDKLNGIARDAMNAAKQADGARKGTAMHDLTERLDRGEDVESVVRGLPAGPARTLRAYAFLRREHGWETVAIERTVVCDELECAGTFDRVERIAGLTALLGPWVCQHGHTHEEESQVIADVKSEAQPWLNGLHIGPQLGIYSRAKRMWEATGGTVKVVFGKQDPVDFPAGKYVPTPCVRQDVGIVVHTFGGEANPYFLNLAEGWATAQAAYDQMNRETRAKKQLGEPGAWFAAMPGIRKQPADIVAQQAAAVTNERGGQRCLVCHEGVAPGQVTCRNGHSVGQPDGSVSVVSTASGAPVEHVATVRPDGMVDWQPAGAGVLGEVDKSAIEVVWAATDLAGLAKVFEIYTETCGRQWGGRVAEAAEARRRQIECPQRQLHTGGGRCACGWQPPLPA